MTGAQLSSRRLLQSRFFPWIVAALSAGVLVLIDLPVCGFRAIFGLPCPGCGMTRALSALLVGDLGSAYAFHPLVFVLVPVLAVLAFVHLALRRNLRTMWLVSAVLAFGVLSFGVWLVRLGGGFSGHPDLAAPLY